jgi:hypothetical protein
MNRKKSKRPGPSPLMGRQLFRGQYAPLLLAGSSGVSPDVYSAAYASATEVVPITGGGAEVAPFVETCDITQEEREWCAYYPGLPFCKKMKIAKGDPQCELLSDPSLKPECPMTDKLQRICGNDSRAFDPGSPDYDLTSFCHLTKVRGMCIDDFIVEQQGEENVKKEEEKQAEQVWKATRGCNFNNFPLQVGINNSFRQTPCPFGTTDDNKPGQIKSLNGKQYKFIGWVPDKP